jgi:hypothetical protein
MPPGGRAPWTGKVRRPTVRRITDDESGPADPPPARGPPGKIFTYATLEQKIGRHYTPNHLRRLWQRNDGSFPAPDFYLSERVPAWTERTLDQHIEDRIAASHGSEHDAKQKERREQAKAAAAARYEKRARETEETS